MTAPIVLIVEGSPELRRMLEESLVQRGYEVAMAHCAQEARELLRRRTADLLIADPPSDGREERHQLEALCREFPDVPSIIVSSDTFDPAIFTPPRDGEAPRRILHRPFRLGELLRLTRVLLPERDGDGEGSPSPR